MVLATLMFQLNTTTASATSVIGTDPVPASLYSLPLRGLLLLLLLTLPYLLREPYLSNKVPVHVLSFVSTLLILSGISAFLTSYATEGTGSGTLRFTLGGLGVLFLYIIVTGRYLAMSLQWAAMTGFTFAILSVLSWTLFERVSQTDINLLEDLFLPLLVILFTLLAVQTYIVHSPSRGRDDPPTGTRVAIGRVKMGTVAEAMIVATLLFGVALLWTYS